MFGREKRPPNYKPMAQGGYALWAIWYDGGAETCARQVKSLSGSLWAGTMPVLFLYADEAGAEARKLARRLPHYRFAVKKHLG